MRRTGALSMGGILLLAGCASAPIEPWSPPEKGLAVIQAEAPSGFLMIDEHLLALPFFIYSRAWRVQMFKPGEHYIAFLCNVRDTGYYDPCIRVYRLTVEAGHVYKFTSESVDVWLLHGVSSRLVDAASGKDVGQIESVSGEPELERATTTIEYPSFALEPPKEDGWYVLRRNDAGAVLIKDAPGLGEHYSLAVRVAAMPHHATREEFLDHVKKDRPIVEGADRFEVLVDSATPFDGRPDFCARTFRRMIDNEHPASDPISVMFNALGRKIGTAKRRIEESYGYACRSRRDKNIEIDFQYSHLCYEGEEDRSLSERAEAAYSGLKF